MHERLRTQSGERLPNFIGIGGQRCGSTSLWYQLRGDDRLFLPEQKELHYFSDRDGDYQSNLENYGRYFEGALSEQCVGEFTPNYLTSAGACRRIERHLPEVKLIVVLRDPVERAISHYNYRVMRGQESRPIGRAMRADMKRCVGGDEVTHLYHAYCQMGLYSSGLGRYLRAFGKDQLLVLFTDDLKSDPDAVRERVGFFLGLGSALTGDRDEGIANQIVTYPRIRMAEVGAKRVLRRWRASDAVAARAMCGLARRVHRINSKPGTPKAPERVVDELRAFYREDTAVLGEKLGAQVPWA
jgi:hypothetical protein